MSDERAADPFEVRLAHLVGRVPALGSLRAELGEAHALFLRCARAGGTIFTAGNGGSAADAEHIAGELMKRFALPRPIEEADALALEERFGAEGRALSAGLEGAIRAISLMSQVALNTAIANDGDYRLAVAQQLYGLARAGDVFVAISTSGNSANILNAARVAQVKGVRVVALTGRGGGQLAPLADVALRVPADLTHEIQELHLPVYHLLCAALEAEIFGGEAAAPTGRA